MRRVIVLAKQLPTNCLFQWRFNTTFAKDWDDFNQHVSNNKLVYVNRKLLLTDNHQKEVFVGSGRLYYEPVAKPYTFDTEKMKDEFEATDNTLYVCPENELSFY